MLHRIIAVMAAMCTAGVTVAADKPNVVVFLVDDMGLMDTSVQFIVDAEGKPEKHPLNDFFRTPNMERLAKQGIRFTDFYANSVCSPTRASILTGQSAARHRTTQFISPDKNNRGTFGPNGWQWKGILPDTVTLPKVVKTAGYHSIHSGKAHFGPTGSFAADPINCGFDVNIAGCAYGRPSSYYGQDGYGNIRGGKNRAVPGLEKYHGTDVHLTEACTIEFNAELERTVKGGKPFFGYLSHYAVHSPFQVDQRFAKNYPEKKGKELAFATLIEGMDKSLGDVLDKLEALGVAEDTLVIFLGDNGTDAPLGATHSIACAAPLRAKKGTHYEGGMRVPFIAAWAKPNPENAHQKQLPIPAGAIQRQIGDVTELLPTIANLVGAKVPADHVVDGRDLAVRLSGKKDAGKTESFLMHFPHSHRSSYFTSYRKGDWKLIYHYQPGSEANKKAPKTKFPRYELFNLKTDRDESTNLADKHPEKLKALVQAMAAELVAANAQYPVDKDGKALKPIVP
jgi:arylsulfatase A-like enzyme